MSAASRALSTASIAVLLAVAVFTGPIPSIVVLALVMGAFAYGWPGLLNLPWLWGSRIVLALVGAATLVVSTAAEPGLANLPFVVVVGVVLAFISEMLRNDGRMRMVESLCGVVGGVVIVVSAAGWLAVADGPGGVSLAVAAAACLAVAAVVSAALPWRGWVYAGVVILITVLAGGGTGALLPHLDLAQGAWAGLISGVLLGSLFVLFDQLPDVGRRAGAIAASVVPVLIGGMLIYIVAGALIS